ncbi:MAG TPA: hypothetical protein VGQ76_03855 [Thermoanaerobaculia bacterium]|jgi:hypothetical protein|nr:hypothetical protein [Thermoanaerobaculia bacterium]
MATRIIVAVLSLSALCCRTFPQRLDVSPSVADTIFVRAKASFCDESPRLVETTSPLFPLAALAQVERQVAGDQLLALIETAERHEEELEKRYVPQRVVLSRAAHPHALIGSVETMAVAGCYAELSPLIENPYRPSESGAFLRIFRGGAVGRSGSTTFWLAVNGDGSVARLVSLPLFVD